MSLPTSPNSFADFGGAKTDFTLPPDPTTERLAAEENAAFAAVAMMTRTAPKAFLQFTGAASSPTPNFHQALWGSSAGVAPVITRTGTGVFTVAFPASVVDALGVTQAVNIQKGSGSIEGSTFGFINVSKTGPSTVQVRLATASGTVSDLVGSLINVEVF